MRSRFLNLILAGFLFFLPSVSAFADDSAKGEIKPAPWSGDWWSRKKGFNVKGWPGHSPSPFERYDAFVLAVTGANPGAWAWESNVRNCHYNPKAEDWEGHCNGWSGAAILEPEPRETKVRNGITFQTSDQKAILSELYMNSYCSFYGKRYWGNNGDDIDDIYPDQFHRLLIEYLQGQKAAVVCDITADRQVWNFPLFKFESKWENSWMNDKKVKVKTTCYFADDGVPPDFIGNKWFAITYTYNLFTDDQGNIINSEWTGNSKNNHPDFVWAPTADAPPPAGTVEENFFLNPKYVHQITTGPATAEIPKESAGPSATPESVIQEAGLDPAKLF